MTTSIKPTPEEMRALLVLAAKAANYTVRWCADANEFCHWYENKEPNNRRADDAGYGELWMPALDDGDLLRLADVCRMQINFHTGDILCTPSYTCIIAEHFTPHNHEEMALAVIKAAAAIQRAREAG